MLSQTIMLTESNTEAQTSEVLHKVTSYFKEQANFVHETNVMINMTASWNIELAYIYLMTEFTGNF